MRFISIVTQPNRLKYKNTETDNIRRFMTWLDIINRYYTSPSQARDILLMHSTQVAALALEIARSNKLPITADDIITAAMLHDIGIIGTDAPAIGCHGTAHYLQHGDIGADMIRACAPEMETFARVAERHTGAGITDSDIAENQLPLSARCHLPQTPLERLICYADKFYSKSASMRRKTAEEARRSLRRFGEASARRFDDLCKEFGEQ